MSNYNVFEANKKTVVITVSEDAKWDKKIRIFRPGAKALLFHEVEDVTIIKHGMEWSIEFSHADYVNKGVGIRSQSVFSSQQCHGYSLVGLK